MAERKRIALNYQTNYDFSAGIVIYIQNLIKGFALLDDSLQPSLLIIHSENSPIDEIKALNYKYISFYCHKPIEPSFPVKVINKISRELSGRNFIRRSEFPGEDILLYPFVDCPETYHFKKRLYWKPDFQEMYFPDFVSEAELNYVKEVLNNTRKHPEYTLVFSSEDSLNDFKKFFSPFSNLVSVLRFVSIIPTLPATSADEIRQKYSLPEKYFFVANQFWPHKNHKLVLQALATVKKHYPNCCIAFSGKQSSYRDGDYFSNLQKFIAENSLEENVKFLGFIPRTDQLLLMKYAQAVIQPSLFEGWSTVIEDCKALGQFVIASDLAVNIEQSDRNILFFPRNEESKLAEGIQQVLENKISRNPYDYSLNIKQFTKDLVRVFSLEQ
ncbi:MAG: glycosyltransferase [Bacteroidetes bacterium]|nr:glycosyltransferase [Bacteroidota bacterium]